VNDSSNKAKCVLVAKKTCAFAINVPAPASAEYWFEQCHKFLRVELIIQNQLIKIHAQSKSSLFLKGDHGVEHNHVITLNLTLFIIPSGSALPAGLAVFKKSEFPLDVAC